MASRNLASARTHGETKTGSKTSLLSARGPAPRGAEPRFRSSRALWVYAPSWRSLAGLVLVLFALFRPAAAAAQAQAVGATASGLCGLVHAGAPRCTPGWVISGSAGYAATQLRGLHQRALGTLGVAYVPLPWLAVSLELAGRLDAHPKDERGSKHLTATGDPWLRGRVGWPVDKGVSLGGELGLWLPGNTAPSYSPKATTVDLKGLLSWVDASQAWTVLGSVGVRVDSSANSSPDPARLRYGDRISLGLSDSHALLLAAGVMRSLNALQLFGELSAQLLLGSAAPSLGKSPLRAAVGARYFFWKGLSAELSVIPVFSQRPNTGPSAALVPIEPRVSVLAGLRYQRVKAEPEPKPVEEHVKQEPVARDEPRALAALRGVLTDEAGAPLPDATVMLNDADSRQSESISQGDGSYTFRDLPTGKATLSVTAPGFAPHMWEVVVVSPLTEVPPERLSPLVETGDLRCFVRSFNSEPLRASVVVRDLRGRKVASGSTDATGLWDVSLPPGEYRVSIEAPGYQSRKSNVQVAPNEVAVLNVDLRPSK